MLRIFIALLLASIPHQVFGQGVPLMTHFSPEEYDAHRQNWAAAQGHDGKMYIGNSAGILIYDGSNWQHLSVSTGNIVRTLKVASDSLIYYGGQNEFGVVQHDSLNNPIVRSLRNTLVADTLELGPVSSIKEHDNAIYFQSSNHIFIYTENRIDVIEAETSFTPMVTLDNELHVHQRGIGIMRVDGATLSAIPGGEQFSGSEVYGGVSFDDKNLIFTRDFGITVYENGNFEDADNEWISQISDQLVWRVAKIDSATFAIGTLLGGVFIADKDLNLLNVVNEQKGLQTNLVYNLFTDHENNIWAALDNGISIIHYGQPLSTYGERSNLYGGVTGLEKIGSRIYAGTTEGLFVMDTEVEDEFRRVDNVSRVVGMGRIADEILLSESNRTIRVFDEHTEIVSDQNFHNVYYQPGQDSVYTTNGSGIYRSPVKFPESTEYLFDAGSRIAELLLYQNEIWVLTDTEVRTFSKQGETLHIFSLEHDSGVTRFLKNIGGRIVAGTDWGMYIYDENEGSFIRQRRHDGSGFGQTYMMSECQEQDLWLRARGKMMKASLNDDPWEFTDTPYQLIGSKANDTIYKIICDDDNTWFGGAYGLYYMPGRDWNYQTEFNTSITRFYVNRDSLIYGGFGTPEESIVLPYDDNQLRFTFAGASYIKPGDTEYSVMLDGFDNDWGNWTTEDFKDYTNIREGSYTLRVRSRNIYGIEGNEASFAFSILPPWYRTYWAYFLYLMAIGAVLFTAHHIRVRQILKIQNIRNRIADDLHDEVSATLSSISYFAKAVERQPAEKRGRFVSLISESADDAKDKITDIIWAINPKHDDWQGLMAKCRRFASDLLESKEIRHHIDITEELVGKPDVEVRQHFWLIFKEIITNSTRHSEATQVNISIKKTGKKILLIVQDNGKGFNTNLVEKGNGLHTVFQRAEKIGAKAELKTEEEFGVRWSVHVDL
ncbi:hypothetical protein DYD21_02755 [Rhodohalobacter sp. SW132]|uniref:sensor histidine kinase n=1 Tax=Rhodohalobacter sp. SW132 TaxID=2293433 RepID=UPI000E21C948|nr:triple tyrosine motif-containing protein [Rhodohalobacter sp. SW132]REL38890.1 hypothetical protein DYD21_02755 [Rhodohalobacter sp. SW132]